VRRADLISGAVIFVAGLVMIYVIVPIQIDSAGDYGLDPAFFPLMVLWLVVIMSALLVLTRIRKPPDPPESERLLDRWNWLFITCTIVFLTVGFIAINRLGFVIAGALMIAVMMVIFELRHLKWAEIAGVSLIAPFVIYWLLYHLFSVQLPTGGLFP